jgi:hypothetical protein
MVVSPGNSLAAERANKLFEGILAMGLGSSR